MQKKMIEVLHEENNQGIELEDSQDTTDGFSNNHSVPEEHNNGQKPPIKLSRNGKIAQKVARKEAEKAHNNDLLRLEKNYFDGVFHADKFADEKDFLIQNMMSKKEGPLKKPEIGNFQQSELLGRLKNFLPKFAADTQELTVNPERKEKMNIDVLDEPDEQKKVIEMNVLMGVFDVKEKSEEKINLE